MLRRQALASFRPLTLLRLCVLKGRSVNHQHFVVIVLFLLPFDIDVLRGRRLVVLLIRRLLLLLLLLLLLKHC